MTTQTEGFTLVEVLVAFVIMSLAVVTGLQVFGDGTRRLAQVQERQFETAKAREALDLAAAGQETDAESKPLPGEAVDWSTLSPHLLRTAAGGQVFETIVLQPVRP
jgi:type II secretory pathway pseudopilin PulG